MHSLSLSFLVFRLSSQHALSSLFTLSVSHSLLYTLCNRAVSQVCFSVSVHVCVGMCLLMKLTNPSQLLHPLQTRADKQIKYACSAIVILSQQCPSAETRQRKYTKTNNQHVSAYLICGSVYNECFLYCKVITSFHVKGLVFVLFFACLFCSIPYFGMNECNLNSSSSQKQIFPLVECLSVTV